MKRGGMKEDEQRMSRGDGEMERWRDGLTDIRHHLEGCTISFVCLVLLLTEGGREGLRIETVWSNGDMKTNYINQQPWATGKDTRKEGAGSGRPSCGN